MAKRSTVGVVAVIAAMILAIYELVAYLTDQVPTITEIVEDLPEFVEAAILIGAAVWAADHWGWINLHRD